MNIIKLVRKFLKFVRGGARPWQVVASCMLGFAIGMTPGFSLTVVAAIGLFLVLNLNLGLMLLGLATGKALCVLLAPVSFALGFQIIHNLGLEGLFRAAAAAPVLAWMNLHNYCFIGGLPFTLIVGGGLGVVLGRTILLVRKAALAGQEKSERVKKLTSNGLVKLLLRVLFGKQKKTLAEMLATKAPAVRKAGVIVCVVFAALLGGAEWLLIDSMAASGLTDGLTDAVGAEVNVEAVDVSLLGGRVGVRGLQVTDPDKPTHNMVQIDELTGDLSVRDLLARRFVMSEIVVNRLLTDAPRQTPGRVIVTPDRPEPPVTEDTVSSYFADGEKILEKLRRLQEYLETRQRAAERAETEADPAEPADVRERAAGEAYLKLSADSILARRPRVTIRRLSIGEAPLGDLGTCSIEAFELSDRPEFNARPMTLALQSDGGPRGEVILDFTTATPRHMLDLFVPDIPVGDGRAIRMAASKPVNVGSALVDVKAVGPFSADAVDLDVVLGVKNLKADASGGALGLNPSAARKVFDAIDQMRVVLTLEGSPAAPKVRVDRQKTLASITDGKLKALLPNIDTDLGSIDTGKLLDGAKLIGRSADGESTDKTKTDDKPTPGDVLRGLFR